MSTSKQDSLSASDAPPTRAFPVQRKMQKKGREERGGKKKKEIMMQDVEIETKLLFFSPSGGNTPSELLMFPTNQRVPGLAQLHEIAKQQ